MQNTKRGSAPLWIIFILVIVGALVYYFRQNLPIFNSIDQQIQTDQQQTQSYEQQVKGYYK